MARDPLAKVKERCRAATKYAIRTGKLVIPDKCERCGTTNRLEVHHHDYTKPLEVTVLCQSCHIKFHYVMCSYANMKKGSAKAFQDWLYTYKGQRMTIDLLVQNNDKWLLWPQPI